MRMYFVEGRISDKTLMVRKARQFTSVERKTKMYRFVLVKLSSHS